MAARFRDAVHRRSCYFDNMRVLFLGTGTSHGIPVIGCTCPVCTSSDPRNRRNRTGVWIREDAGNEPASAVIDVSGEFRVSALRFGLTRLDFALLTHGHSDHVSGLDDLRVFSQTTGKAVPIYADARTLKDIRSRFSYAFNPPKDYGGGTPQYAPIEVTSAFHAGPWQITPLPVLHGPEPILGYRIGNFAFITDVTVIPEETLALMRGLDVLALDCLRRKPHSTHLALPQSIDYARRIGAKRTFFIHMAHDLEHAETENELPERMNLAYDGLEVECG
jgi:phosphoribosyl 1,2-cyclic phosphate phosphodiesterase